MPPTVPRHPSAGRHGRRVAGLAVAALCCAGAVPRAGAQPAAPAASSAPAVRPAVPATLVAPRLTPAPTAAATVAQAPAVQPLSLSPGRVLPVTLGAAVTRAAVIDTAVADVMIVSDRDVLFTGRRIGETDVLLWTGGQRRQYRVTVAPAADRPQVVLAVKFAEVRRDALRNFGVSMRTRTRTGEDFARGGTGAFGNSDAPYDPVSRTAQLPDGFASLVTNLGTRDLTLLLQAEEQRGNARILAEPTLTTANRDSASFLAGGEFPVPAGVAAGAGGVPIIQIAFKEFGVRLNFAPEVLADSLVKLHVRPEVSSLDYGNAVLLSGIRVPALRTRRLESTVDVRSDRSVVISGLLNDERQRVRTGLPGLMSLPVLGALFSSTRWQNSETELVVIVTPTVVDPSRPRPQDAPRLRRDVGLPARDVVGPRLADPAAVPAAEPASRAPAVPPPSSSTPAPRQP